MRTVDKNSLVAVHYVGTLGNGEVFDSSEGRDPLRLQVGQGHVIPGFDRALVGMNLEEERTITISPEDAYGDRDEKRVFTLERKSTEWNFEPAKGLQLALQTPEGHQMMAVIKDVTETHVTLDLNHPLAGETLTFKLRVVEVCEEGEAGSEAWANLDEACGEGCGDEGCCGGSHEGSCCGAHDHGDEHDHGNGGCGGCGGH